MTRRILISVGCACALTGVYILSLAQPANSATVSNLQTYSIREDSFRNYDFLSQRGSSYNVDWPITLLFWGNAEIDKVKGSLDRFFPSPGSSMNALWNNGAGWKWDSDRGKKQWLCNPFGSNIHYRIYAPQGNGDRFYNLSWRYYTLASTHVDYKECAPRWVTKWSGLSEDAERYVANSAKLLGWTISWNWSWFKNPQPARLVGDHYWQSNGYGTAIKVP